MEMHESTQKALFKWLLTLNTYAILLSVGLLWAFPIKWTWNATMPYLFSLPVLTWGKALCLHFLAITCLKSILIQEKHGK